MAVVEDRLGRTASALNLQKRKHHDPVPLTKKSNTRAERTRERERVYKILPIRRQIVRQALPTQRVDDWVGRERAGALFAVCHEGLARLRHLRDRVFGGPVLRLDELVAGDGAGVVVCVGLLEVWGAVSAGFSGHGGREREGRARLGQWGEVGRRRTLWTRQ